MENKIRVWDKEISCCNECKYSQFNSFEGTCICREINSNRVPIGNRDKDHIEPIYKDCPFAKPLSKEDIESCGFEINNGVSDNYRQNYEMCGIHGKQRGTFGVTIYDINKLSVYIYDGIREYILFTGIVNNLQEFKLLLKQLNIE